MLLIIIFSVIILILLLITCSWYYFTGWESFSFYGQLPYSKDVLPPSWKSSHISKLRFKSCTFQIIDLKNKKTDFTDVTSILNGMAAAYTDTAAPQVLSLDRPLNPFSFTITGVNDNPKMHSWDNYSSSLIGKVRTI